MAPPGELSAVQIAALGVIGCLTSYLAGVQPPLSLQPIYHDVDDTTDNMNAAQDLVEAESKLQNEIKRVQSLTDQAFTQCSHTIRWQFKFVNLFVF